jgi:hypothetical protein
MQIDKNMQNDKNTFKELQWPLIFGLGALAFVMPFLNLSGLMDQLGRPFGPILAITLISLVWLLTVVFARVRHPILTLTCTGVVHGLFAFVIGTILAPLLTGAMFAPLANPFTLPFALTGVLVTNTLWGLAVGVVAWAVQRVSFR